MKAPTQRFSDRVENYRRYRPGYPEAVIDVLMDRCHLDETSVIADIGSGTGIFTRQLLGRNLRVIAIEPNREMRQAAESLLAGYDLFSSVEGRAEASNLPDSMVDLIVSAQAFHWFQRNPARKEFARILKPCGWVALLWNQRKVQQQFQQDYDALIREQAPEYNSVNHMNIGDEVIAGFFDPQGYQNFEFANVQVFDKKGFLGRMQSSSYTPAPGCPEYPQLMAAAELLFARYAENLQVRFEYNTRLYLGTLNSR